jgi:uncharacterized membrane protein YjjP (DUF1212 family)
MPASLKGYRTILVGLGLAVAPSAISYLSGLDWNRIVGPTGAFFVSGLLMTAMRFVTSTPPGSKA